MRKTILACLFSLLAIPAFAQSVPQGTVVFMQNANPCLIFGVSNALSILPQINYFALVNPELHPINLAMIANSFHGYVGVQTSGADAVGCPVLPVVQASGQAAPIAATGVIRFQ